MKRYFLIALLLVAILSNLFGKIKNGYEKELLGYRLSLEKLSDILWNNQTLSASQQRDIKAKIKLLIEYIACHEITDILLKEFKSISPDLFNEIDTLSKSDGKKIDVYVKFVPWEEAKIDTDGIASFFHQAANDSNTCNSEYGEGSVSVKVWIKHRALTVLAHEFGHVRYFVPNLQSYVKFYNTAYRHISDPSLGHLPDDPSGKVAAEYERRFRESYARYLKDKANAAISPLALINPIKRDLFNDLNN